MLRLRSPLAGAVVALVVAVAAPVAAQLAPPAAPSSHEPSRSEPAGPVIDPAALADGSCATPRHAWLQLLYWLQPERWFPDRASACFDLAAVGGARRAAELAARLKGILDARPIWVDVDEIPDDASVTDINGLHRYEAPSVGVEYPGLSVVRHGRRWEFSSEAAAAIEAYYPSATGLLERVLPAWTRTRLLGIEVWKYLGVLLLVMVAVFLQKLVVHLVARSITGAMARRGRSHGPLHKASGAIGGLAMSAVFYLGFPLLLFPPKVSAVAMAATKALAAFSSVWLAYRLIDVLIEILAEKAGRTDSKLDDQLVPLLGRSLKIFVAVVGGIFLLQNLDVDVGSLLAGLGLGGLAFALAAKDTVANLFGSVMIFVDRPFQIGDWVVISGVEGVVEEVGFRTTRIRTFYDSLVTVPNANVVSAAVDNYGARRYRRYSTTVSITYQTPPDKVQAFCEGIRAILAAMPQIRKDYYLVELKQFGESSLDVMLYCFFQVPDWGGEMRARHYLNVEILRLADSLGVSFAFPTRTLHVETLAALGEARSGLDGPARPEELATVVDGFGPGGALGGRFAPISRGYDNVPVAASPPPRGGDVD